MDFFFCYCFRFYYINEYLCSPYEKILFENQWFLEVIQMLTSQMCKIFGVTRIGAIAMNTFMQVL